MDFWTVVDSVKNEFYGRFNSFEEAEIFAKENKAEIMLWHTVLTTELVASYL